MSFDLEFWKQSEGQTVDAVFPLGRCLSGDHHSAFFETDFQNRPAVIKIIPGTPDAIQAQLALWEKSAHLSHPALVSTFARGQTALGDAQAAYLVMERTDDNLADLLADRPLTATETREMLVPLLGALQYLHRDSFTHGSVNPAHILASGDQLKISSDSLVPGGDPASDSLAIGTLLKEVLGANRNARLPEPFAEIAQHCSMPDPAARWNLSQIEACLRGESEPVTDPPSRTPYWALAAAAVVVLALFAFWPSPPKVQAPTVEPPAPTADARPAPALPETNRPSPFKPSAGSQRSSTPPEPAPVVPSSAGVTPPGVTKVLPDIPEPARKTITGRVRVSVRVRVDSAGNVDKAALERPRSSRYLSGRVLAAAQSWKFPPGNPPQDWMLRFELTRQETLASAVKLGN